MKVETISVTTHELAEGDEIIHYGVRFRLKNRKDWGIEKGFDPVRQGACITFETDLIEYPEAGSPMPRGWAESWTIQGNKLARWAKVV